MIDKDRLLQILDEMGFETTTVSHEPAFTVAESQHLRDEIPGGHTKNLFLKDKKSNYFLITMEESAEVDLKQVHTLIGGRGRVSFGNAERLQEYLGVVPGSVTAFSVANDTANQVTFIIDEKLLEYDIINCHPMQNDATTSIKRDDLIKFVKHYGHDPLILKISQ